MKKCNYCGSTVNPIFYSHPFEPRACEVCAPRFFQNIGGKVFPVQYNSQEYNGLLAQLHPRMRENLGKKLEAIYDKSVAREMKYVILGGTLRLIFQTEYRKKMGFIVVEVDTVTGMIRSMREVEEGKVRELASLLAKGLPIF